jgi:hypothetical protein
MTEGVKLKADKGHANGSCNRTACQAPLADEPEHQFMEGNLTGGTRLHYCRNCALLFDRVDDDNRLRGATTLPNRIMREAKAAGRAARAEGPAPPGGGGATEHNPLTKGADRG